MHRPDGNTITVVRYSDQVTLNPLLYTDLASGEINNRIYDHLVLTDEHMRFIPGRLLDSWEVDPGGLVWTFHMKRGAAWHDGVEVTAYDAQFTFEAILDPAVGSPRRSEYTVGGQPIQFRALGRYTLEARLPMPFAAFLDSMAWRPIIPRHRLGGTNLLEPPSPSGPWPVGNGPFRLEAWTPGDRIVLGANPHYHLERTGIDRVIWRYVPDKKTALELLLQGEVDYVPGLEPEDRAAVLGSPHLDLRQFTDGNYTYLAFHVEHPLFRDVRVRWAFNHALDKQRLVNSILPGQADVAHSMVSPVRPWHNPAIRKYRCDKRLALQLLAEAGWHPNADGVLAREGQEFRFPLYTAARDPIKVKTAHWIAAQLAEIGIMASVEEMEQKELLTKHIYQRQYAAAILAMVPTFDVEDLYSFYHSTQFSPAGWNRMAYSNPSVDRLLDLGRTTLGFDERKPLYDQVQDMIVADAPQVYLFHVHTVDGFNRSLQIPQQPGAYGNRYMLMHRWRVGSPMPAPVQA